MLLVREDRELLAPAWWAELTPLHQQARRWFDDLDLTDAPELVQRLTACGMACLSIS
jgi:hypothetical protein